MLNPYNLTALELIREPLQKGQTLHLKVNGRSMQPLLRPGDRVVVEAFEAERLSCGDLLLIRRPADLVTHRLIAREGDRFVTKGDASPCPDLPVLPEAVLGRVVAVEKGAGRLDLNSPAWRARSRLLGRLGAWEAAGWSGAPEPLRRLAALPFTLALRGLAFMFSAGSD